MKNICEICKKIINTDTHHIRSLSKNGTDKLFNKCKICPNCHRLIHVGEIILEGRFTSTNCKHGSTELVFRKKGEPSITGVKDPEVWIYGQKIITSFDNIFNLKGMHVLL